MTASSSATLDEILQPPTIFSRSVKKRAYKQSNHGVLTSERLISECQKVDAEVKQKQLDQDQRKILINMKKERVQKEKDEKKAAKARKEEIEKKKKQLNADKEPKKPTKRKASELKVSPIAPKRQLRKKL